MDFFQFARLAEFFIPYSAETNNMWICLLVGGLCFLIVYIFQAIGLYTIARREGYSNKWMAFVPFFSLYYIGVCGQKNKVYSVKTKTFAIICVALELLLVICFILYYVSVFTVWDYIEWRNSIDVGNVIISVPIGLSPSLPAGYAWLGWIFVNLQTYVIYWLELVFLIIKLLLLMSFFKTYSARHYFIFSVCCTLFPLTGILIYIVRNNSGKNYNEYIRAMREQQYRIYQQQFGGNPYSNGNDGTPYGGGDAPDPFEDLGGSSGGQQDAQDGASSDQSSSDGKSPFEDFN